MRAAYKSSVTNHQRTNALKSTSATRTSAPDRVRPTGNFPQGTTTRHPTSVPILPSARKPLWLIRLSVLQRSSTVVLFFLIATVLALYTGTIYSQRKWYQSYEKRENLQRQERQITTAIEVLKNKMAQQAEQPETGLLPADPTQAIFLKPAPQRPARPVETIVSATSMTRKSSHDTTPVGY
ncbi:hypothetical protein Glo7428_2911 [Gloeocapsa sp. PCC 7428]|uniref:hypothetical protein n=1 Tax=Gloeocapsa sp. PCC 7428 TaxID=1173026 RepID=UPI0002A60A44|nr:hypothetical protein [Gloeocapsa sp. PCC 7428]AFZ31406.1 hypothetical protein Glo7428_2911 [Gloeocapsa sp. PCC 7428]